jgi:RNA polymerase sigma-70 factor (ECF subfamily)
MDEAEAIERLKRGDASGLEELVRRHQDTAVRAAYLVTHDEQLAEDLVQTAFLRAYERIAQFDSTRPFRPWFMRSLINAAVKAARRAERSVSLDQDSSSAWAALAVVDHRAQPEMVLERTWTARAVRDALARLSPSQRAVVVLRYYLEMDETDIADHLAIPRGTVKSRLHSARERLRVLLVREAPSASSSRQEDRGACKTNT